ncbi:uncharacterized protein LOC133517390 [Cydia pomonella]|uniref:uncharacterized protein LOC133517390 n=1 Tax=Cydia pomonella TaxID=82600 RepID=UPI002ADD4C8C|nr:uncharacterized protein LOC133517390 [Cydia pomonella]
MRFFDAPTHLETRDTIMTRIIFPSVMVCPELYYQDYKIENLLQNKKYPPGMSAHTIRPIIKQLAAFFSPDVPYYVDDITQIIEFLEYNDLDVEEAGLLLASSCEETLLRCRYLKEDYDCSNIFHMEITMYGICCTFNGRSLKRDIKLGGDKTTKLRVWYSSEVGPYASLIIAVNQSQHLDNVDLSYKWLAIQKNRRYIDGTSNGTALSPGTEVWSSFHAKYLKVTEDSRFMGDELRGCRSVSKQLQFFQGYNKYLLFIINLTYLYFTGSISKSRSFFSIFASDINECRFALTIMRHFFEALSPF